MRVSGLYSEYEGFEASIEALLEASIEAAASAVVAVVVEEEAGVEPPSPFLGGSKESLDAPLVVAGQIDPRRRACWVLVPSLACLDHCWLVGSHGELHPRKLCEFPLQR